jgi:hypothetical protein
MENAWRGTAVMGVEHWLIRTEDTIQVILKVEQFTARVCCSTLMVPNIAENFIEGGIMEPVC